MKIDLKVLKESFYILLIVMIPIAVIAIYYYNPQDDIDESVELAYREMIINDKTYGDISHLLEETSLYDSQIMGMYEFYNDLTLSNETSGPPNSIFVFGNMILIVSAIFSVCSTFQI